MCSVFCVVCSGVEWGGECMGTGRPWDTMTTLDLHVARNRGGQREKLVCRARTKMIEITHNKDITNWEGCHTDNSTKQT